MKPFDQTELEPYSLNINLDSEIRTGVFICDCGEQSHHTARIANRLNTEELSQQSGLLNGVVYTGHEAYPCSKDGRLRVCQTIAENKLNRVLIAGCTPRLIEKLFKQTIQSTGLDAAMLEIVDIREQCANVHPAEVENAQRKAIDLVEMGAARLANLSPAHYSTNRIERSAAIIGSSLAGLTASLSLAHTGIPVTLLEPGERLGDLSGWSDEDSEQAIEQQLEAIAKEPRITAQSNIQIQEITGSPGEYQIEYSVPMSVGSNRQTIKVKAGAILIANAARPQAITTHRWIDRSRVKTQVEFAQELAEISKAGDKSTIEKGLALQDVVMIFCAGSFSSEHCSRLCCNTGIQQAIRIRQLYPQANVTILFRDLFLGGPASDGEALFKKATQLGITFFRYHQQHPPVITNQTVDLPDPLTGETLHLPCDRIVLAMPLAPQENTRQLAALLHLPQDQRGFLIQPRIRLRPGRFADNGIFVLGSSHQPGNLNETLFQAYLTSARVQRFLSQGTVHSEAPAAQINPQLCTGCGECAQVCLSKAIHLEKRPVIFPYPEVLSLSSIDPLRCTGCGSCAVACPVKAITIPGWEDNTLLAEISAVLHPPARRAVQAGIRQTTQPQPRILVLACEWSAYAAADIAGAQRQPYPANIRILRMNCSARFDPNHILWAFLNGAQGVLLGACPPGECHYGGGNLQARERVLALKQQFAEYGIDPNRLHLEHLSVDDGEGFVKAIRNFTAAILDRLPEPD